MAKERDRQRREERERERERERAREKKREEERERERRRHASRSPLHHHHSSRSSTGSNGAAGSSSSKTDHSSSSSSSSKPSSASSSGLASSLPHLPGGYHPSLQMTPPSILDRSRLGLPPLPGGGLYGAQSFDPYRDVLRGMDPVRESLDREQRELLSRYGSAAAANPLVGLGGPASLYGHSSPHSPYGLPGLPPERYRDASLQGLPGPLGHHPLGLSLTGQPSDRYPPLSSLYPPTSTAYPFPHLGPPGLLGAGLSSLAMLPPSLMPPSASGSKRTPPPPTTPSTPLPGGGPPAPQPPSLASLGRTHLGLMGPAGLALPPYPLSSPSSMLAPASAHHLGLPSLGSSRPTSESTPPAGSSSASATAGRPLLDLTSPHAPHPPALAPYSLNPLDPYARLKEDPQSR